jgi:hypothetical protein
MANRMLFMLGLFVFFLAKKMIKIIGANDSAYLRLLPSTKTGINFTNQITEKEDLTYIDYEAIYQGAGVAF